MSRPPLPLPLSGIIPPMVTPLIAPDVLDRMAVSHLVEHVLEASVHGLFILGTTGEGPALSYRLRLELIDAVCAEVRKRVPVLVGITDSSFEESLTVARYAAEAGAAAVVVAPPPYYPTAQPELLVYFRHLANALPLPLFLYNMPSHTKVRIEPETVRLAAGIPGIVGLKDSSGNMVDFHRTRLLVHDLPEFSLLVGPEELLAESVLLGAHGGVSGGANLAPTLYVALYEAARSGDLERVREFHHRVIELSTQLYGINSYGSSMLRGLKCALSLNGLCRDVMAEPFTPFPAAERAQVAARLEALGLAQTSGVHARTAVSR